MLKVCAQWQQFQKLWLLKLFLTTLFMHWKVLPFCLLWINSLLYLQTGGVKCASSVISFLGAMTGPQLLHAVMAQLMLLLLWQLSGEDLSHNPHNDIILKHNHACYCQYSHRVALCQRGAVLILSLYLESFSFTVWWNAKPALSMSLPVVKQRCPVCPLKFWLSGGCFIICISPWNCCQFSLWNQLFVWCPFWSILNFFLWMK